MFDFTFKGDFSMSQADAAAAIAAIAAAMQASPSAAEQKLADDCLVFAAKMRDEIKAHIETQYTSEELKKLAPSLFGGVIVLLMTDTIVTHCKTDPEKFQALKDVIQDVAAYVDGGLTIDVIVEADKKAKAATA